MVKANCRIALLAACAGATAAPWTVAGPLNPPAGPITPTYKTLAEVEPRAAVQALPGDAEALHVITQPGSYYLTGNITGVAGKAAIKIASADVTLDLGGFAVTGPGPTSNPAHAGVLVPLLGPAASPNITIRNGSIRAWTTGVNATYATNARLESLATFGNSTGLDLGGDGLISDCVSENDGNGIRSGGRVVIARCVVREAAFIAIETTGAQSIISDCLVFSPGSTAVNCAGTGTVVRSCTVQSGAFEGIRLIGSGGLVQGCTAQFNGHHGIVLGIGSTATGNVCRQNGGAITDGAGIHATGADNRIEANNLVSNDRGITTVAAGNLVIRNSASGNTTAYSFAAGTVAGPTVTSATILTSTSPHANYDF